MLKKLKVKFVLVNMGIVLAMLLVIFSLVFRFTETELENRADTMLQKLLQSAQQPVVERDPDVSLPYIVMRISSRGEVVAYGVTGYDLTDDFIREMIGLIYDRSGQSGYLEEYGMEYCRQRGAVGETIALLDTSSHQDTLDSLITTSLLIGTASLLVLFGISILFANWAVKPVGRAWKNQKQFVSDASHELKTPLTVIMSNAEMLCAAPAEAESDRRLGENILAMSRQMRNLVEGMLELSRVDDGQVKRSFERLDLSAMVEESVLPFEPLYFEQGLLLESRITPDIHVKGNAQYLRQVVDILLDNAGKYTQTGTVVLELQRYGRNQALLSLFNPGVPIPEEELEKIFDRFYRVDKARTRTGSFGLGLAIAKSTVLEHQGKIWAQSNENGNLFCVLLPCEA